MGMVVAAEAQTVSFGPRIGVVFATLRIFDGEKMYPPEYKEDYKYITGAQLGAVANFRLSDKFSIQPEILYSQKGYEAHISFIEDDPVGDMRAKLRMNYLEVPLLAKLSFGSERLQAFLAAGPSIGYWMSGKSEWAYAGQAEKKDYAFQNDYKNGTKENRLDMGANIGVGVAYPLGSGALNVDVRYGLGLSGINKYDNDRTSDTPKEGHRSFGVSVAYLFKGR